MNRTGQPCTLLRIFIYINFKLISSSVVFKKVNCIVFSKGFRLEIVYIFFFFVTLSRATTAPVHERADEM